MITFGPAFSGFYLILMITISIYEKVFKLRFSVYSWKIRFSAKVSVLMRIMKNQYFFSNYSDAAKNDGLVYLK